MFRLYAIVNSSKGPFVNKVIVVEDGRLRTATAVGLRSAAERRPIDARRVAELGGQRPAEAGAGGARETAHERLHGVVPHPTEADLAGESEEAQLGDLEAARRGMEVAARRGEATLHRRGEATARHAPAGASRLQVPAA